LPKLYEAAGTVTAGEVEIEWDWLVLAVGGVTSYFGRDDWRAYAPGLKTLDDALGIRSPRGQNTHAASRW